MKFLIMQFLQSRVTSSLFGPNTWFRYQM
jgi:hypothetical protein